MMDWRKNKMVNENEINELIGKKENKDKSVAFNPDKGKGQALKKLAEERGISISELLRESADVTLKQDEELKEKIRLEAQQELKQELTQEMSDEIKKNLSEEIRIEIKEEMKAEILKTIPEEMFLNIKNDISKQIDGFRQETGKLNQEITELKKEMIEIVNGKNKIKLQEEEEFKLKVKNEQKLKKEQRLKLKNEVYNKNKLLFEMQESTKSILKLYKDIYPDALGKTEIEFALGIINKIEKSYNKFPKDIKEKFKDEFESFMSLKDKDIKLFRKKFNLQDRTKVESVIYEIEEKMREIKC